MYYDMPLVTFGVDGNMNLVIQFPIFIQPYTQEPLLLYQIETVPVPILDTNTVANSYTNLQVNKPYIALNKEIYISLTNEGLRSCKIIGKMFYCKELFVIKHKSNYSCESAIYFNLTTDIIKDNCNFDFYYNRNDIIPTILDGGNEIILANWPNDKHIICNKNNDIPVKIPSHPYVLVDRNILCNCGLEADNHHLLESLAACNNRHTKLKMYFTINLAFTNYLYDISNLTEYPSIDRSMTDYEQILPIHLNISTNFECSLHSRPSRLKDFIYKHMQDNAQAQEIFDLQKGHATPHASLHYKNFFSNTVVNVFTFTSSAVSIITIILVVYLYCKHKHIRTIIASLILHKAKEVEANTPTRPENTECQTLVYIGITLTLLSMMIVVLLHYRRSKFCRGYRFSNIVKIVLFISDIQHYMPVKLTKTTGSPHLFKFTGTLNSEDIKLNKNYLWDMLEINWDKIQLTFNDSEIKLPRLVTIKMRDKIRVRRIMGKTCEILIL